MMMGMLLYAPSAGTQAAKNALKLWGLEVVPSLFPYMVFCRMLSARLKAYDVPVALSSSALGLLGGSPAGAAALSADGTGNSRVLLLPLCALTGTMSPMFLYGTVGRWMNASRAYSLLLPMIHVLSALICALVLYVITIRMPHAAREREASPLTSAKESDPISESADAIITVGGCIVFYSVVSAQISGISWIPEQFAAIIHAVLESAGGIHAILNASYQEHVRMVLLAAASGFSGISILSQNYAFLRRMGVRFSQLVSIAILRAAISAILMSIACMVIQASISRR